ncbi:MAG: hypothetical protein M3Y71_14400 [Actinomycetota bacterium]|nr:hypothetical protein [Actinomycetota bacterium]
MPPRIPHTRPRRRALLPGLALFALLAAVLVPTLTLPAPTASASSGPPVSVGGPAGHDYATDHFGDPWDYSNSSDLLTDAGPALGVSSIGMSGGSLAAHFSGNGYISPIWGGYGGSTLLGRDGGRPGNQLDTSVYRTVAFQAYSSATVPAGLIWFNCAGGGVAQSCGGGMAFTLQAGWHTYNLTPGASRYSGWPLAWGGSVNGLRLASTPGIDFRLDWMRVVQPGSGTNVSWSNPSGGTGTLMWRTVSSAQPGSGSLGTVSGTSGTFNLSQLPAGTYQVGVADTKGAVAFWQQVTLTTPLPRILTPNESGDRDYATQVLHDPWDFHNSSDIAAVGNATAQSWAGGQFSATNTSNDPYVMMRLGSGGIDGTTYRHLTVSSAYSGPFDLRDVSGGGTMARVQWQRTDRGWGQTNDLLTYSGSRTIMADLGGPASVVLEPDSTSVPYSSSSRVSLLRWDPNEDRGPRRWYLRSVQLRSDFRTTGDFVVSWTDAAYAPGGVATLVADTDRTGCDGATVATGVPVAPGTNRTVWNTRGLRAGAYWLCLKITRAGGSTAAYAGGAVVVGVNPPAPDQNPVASWDGGGLVATTAGLRYSVGGWSFDPSAPQNAVNVDVYDHRPDGTVSGVRLTTGGARTDVSAAYPGTRVGTGYSTQLSPTPGRHSICVYAINIGVGAHVGLGCRTIDVPGLMGHLDGVGVSGGQVHVSGWAVDPSDPAALMTVHVYVVGPNGSHTLTALTTGAPRADVARSLTWPGPMTGYTGGVPSAGPGASTVCVYAIALHQPGGNALLGCGNVTVP